MKMCFKLSLYIYLFVRVCALKYRQNISGVAVYNQSFLRILQWKVSTWKKVPHLLQKMVTWYINNNKKDIMFSRVLHHILKHSNDRQSVWSLLNINQPTVITETVYRSIIFYCIYFLWSRVDLMPYNYLLYLNQ